MTNEKTHSPSYPELGSSDDEWRTWLLAHPDAHGTLLDLMRKALVPDKGKP